MEFMFDISLDWHDSDKGKASNVGLDDASKGVIERWDVKGMKGEKVCVR